MIVLVVILALVMLFLGTINRLGKAERQT